MTDLDVLEGLQSILGGTIYRTGNRNPGAWKDAWVWVLAGTHAARVMEVVRPFMKSRRRARITEILEAWYLLQDRRLATRETSDLAGAAYAAGSGSLRQLAKQYGVSIETVRQRARRPLVRVRVGPTLEASPS